MKRRKNIITVAIDAPAAAGAGTLAKKIANNYKLLYLDTGKLYRLIGKMALENKKLTYKFIKSKVSKLKIIELHKKDLLADKVANSASLIAKDKNIRKIIKEFQVRCAYNPPKKFSGSVLDGRDITSVIMKDAMFKFYVTANLQVRAKRKYLTCKY